MLEEMQPAPDFTLPTDSGSEVKLSDLRGQKVVLYFYPKDMTPGCTTQACDLRDRHPEFEARDAVVLGVSPDPVETHAKFRKKHGLPFPLLADTERKVARAYGVWKEKKLYGGTSLGIERTTFVIDENGLIQRIIRKVKPAKHAEQVLEEL